MGVKENAIAIHPLNEGLGVPIMKEIIDRCPKPSNDD